MADDNQVDANTKQGLRILADSTKLKGTEGVARRLSKAADSGMIEDYQQAETIFDSLPVDKRATIKVTAETKAETIRLTNQKRKETASTTPQQNTIAPDSAAWDLGDPNSDEGIFNNKIVPTVQQNTPELKNAPKLFKSNCKIDWSKSSLEIYNHIRGLSPYPVAWTNIISDNGRWIITDYFRINDDGINKSGHMHKDFLESVKRNGWTIIHKNDMTLNALPTLKFAITFIDRFIKPLALFAN